MTFSVGDTVGAYRILEDLGSGGMGQVFKVEHTITRRLEAMKVLEGGRPEAPEQAARSLREIQVQASLDHPNIAAVHNAFWEGEDLVLVMELIEGRSLRRLMEAGRAPLKAAIGYSCQALAALGYAHAHGVIHRDVSPSNMMVSSGGVLKLTDFGLSKGPADPRPLHSGAPAGSPYYMSPEQVQGPAPAGARSDIYSLGAVLYELATGKKPFEGESAFAIMTGHVWKPPAAPIELEPSLPPWLNHAILRSLAKDPADRFSSAEEFRQALMPAEHSRIALWRTSSTFLARSWVSAATGSLAVLALAVGGFLLNHRWHGRVNAPAAVVVDRSPIPPQAPLEPIPQPIPSPPPQANPPRQRTVAKTPRIAPATIPSQPRPAISDAGTPPEEERVIRAAGTAEPAPPLRPPEERLGGEVAGAAPVPAEAEVEVTPKPGPNRLKKSLSKLWRLVRRKKSSSEDGDSLRSPEKP